MPIDAAGRIPNHRIVDYSNSSSSSTLPKEEEYTGAEAFLVGLSPSFWAHVPLWIHQVHSALLLEDGVHCLILSSTTSTTTTTPFNHGNDNDNDGNSGEEDTPPLSPSLRVIPISKCKLYGTIVYSKRKSNGCVQYVLDDGTGVIDCLHWDTEQDDVDGLPSLTGSLHNSRSRHSESKGVLPPGTVVRVLGRLHCVAVQDDVPFSTIVPLPVFLPPLAGVVANNNHISRSSNSTATIPRTKSCRVSVKVLREIHASVLEPIHSFRRASPHSLDWESQHWLECIHVQQQQCLPRCIATDIDSPAKDTRCLLNALGVLQCLGPDISAQVADRTNLPAVDDTCGLWRLFGTQCRCTNKILQQELLYCHCIATPNALDIDFGYRDGLLEALLHQQEHVEMPEEQFSLSLSPDSSDDGIILHSKHLLFTYQSVASNTYLNLLSTQQIQRFGPSEHLSQQSQIQQLVRSTFRALCKDGILHLIDAASDTYLLVSKSGVLEPYIRQSLACSTAAERTMFFAMRPSYLSNVPKSRLNAIRRMLMQATSVQSLNVETWVNDSRPSTLSQGL